MITFVRCELLVIEWTIYRILYDYYVIYICIYIQTMTHSIYIYIYTYICWCKTPRGGLLPTNKSC